MKEHFGTFFYVTFAQLLYNFVQRNRKQDRQYTYPVTSRNHCCNENAAMRSVYC
jgi:hypothetical protein